MLRRQEMRSDSLRNVGGRAEVTAGDVDAEPMATADLTILRKSNRRAPASICAFHCRMSSTLLTDSNLHSLAPRDVHGA